ncbi:MAG: response regulator transcription factor [Bacteroidetes bacterium]|nr:response regulator transcription factor [Bacteroidota bacterium]
MIRKILIAEDYESANISVQKTLEDLGGIQADYVFYCDDALLKIQKARQDDEPYDLLITDLSFEEDGQKQHIPDGIVLIDEARKIQPDLKVLVFSVDGKPATIEMLFEKQGIDGYVRKARNDAKEIKSAIKSIEGNQRYYPRHLVQLVKQKNAHKFTDFEITIISLLSQGMRQKDIPSYLKKNKIKPSGLSSIEKHLNHMKEILNFSNNEQLVAYCKDMGIV